MSGGGEEVPVMAITHSPVLAHAKHRSQPLRPTLSDLMTDGHAGCLALIGALREALAVPGTYVS